MNRAGRLAVSVLTAVVLACGAARADEGSALRANVLAAMGAVASYRVALSSPQGLTGVVVVTPPTFRTKAELAAASETFELYALDGYFYQRADGGPWYKRKLPDPHVMVGQPFGPRTPFTPRGDRTDGGTTYGSFSAVSTVTLPDGGTLPPLPMTCTYDKRTFRLHACTSSALSLAFSAYDDPNNVIDLPSDARHAAEIKE